MKILGRIKSDIIRSSTFRNKINEEAHQCTICQESFEEEEFLEHVFQTIADK